MSGQIIIAGFSSLDRVPGAYGETRYASGANSAASIPLQLLLVGQKSPTEGSARPNRDVLPMRSDTEADASFGPRSELGRMCKAGLRIPDVTIQAAAVAAPVGAVAATLKITIAGTWGRTGSWVGRLAGKWLNITVGSTDTPADVATHIADAITSTADLPYRAAANGPDVTLTCECPGVRGNQHIVFQDTSFLPQGCTSVLTGGVPVAGDGVPFAGGTGVEDISPLLTVLFPVGYDRIACALNDPVNLRLWRGQLAAQASPTEGKLEHFIAATNDTLTVATGLAATTLNDQRFQLLWYLNSETHPSEIAAVFGAIRTEGEQADPAAAYDDVILPDVAPQSQVTDWPSHATLVAAINSGVSPIRTTPDGKAQVVISITTHCMNGTIPDYSTFDTSAAYVPDFVRRDLALYWSSVVKPGNPRVADDPAPGEKARPSGVATPALWNSVVEFKLRDYEEGKIGGTAIAPIIVNVDRHKPFSVFDKTSNRIMSAITVEPAPPFHQLGFSVRNAA